MDTNKTDGIPGSPGEFSLALGGPLFQLLRKAHLSDDALHLLRRRILAISLFCWLPLLVLSASEGRLLGGVAVPFLKDIDVQAKFLVAMPLLIVAELVVHMRLRPTVEQFLKQGLVPESERASFDEAVTSAMKLRNSLLAEVLLILFVYGCGIPVVWRLYGSLGTSTWYATPTDGAFRLTLTGIWYAFVSLPVFQFLIVRWFFRLLIWARFLFRVSRLDLDLVPTHPDRTGGLGFLSGTLAAFVPLATAYGALLAGGLANRILHSGGKLPDFKWQIAAAVALLVAAVAGPLLVFGPRIARTKRKGRLEYSALAQRYVREYDAKWLRGGAPPDEPFVGSGDIQSLADLGNGYEVIQQMRAVPVSTKDATRLAAAALAPMVPLLLTMMPFEELLKLLFGLLT
jgi:hypothetical protein